MPQYLKIGNDDAAVLEVREPVLDRITKITGTEPESKTYFQENPVVYVESSFILVEGVKALQIVYQAYSVRRMKNVPVAMKHKGSFIVTTKNIEKLLNDKGSRKDITIRRYDKQEKVRSPEYKWSGIELHFSVNGSGKGTVTAGTCYVEDINKHAIYTLGILGQPPPQEVLGFIAGSEYELPSDSFIVCSNVDKKLDAKRNLMMGTPNQKAVDEIVENLLPMAVKEFQQGTRRLVQTYISHELISKV